MLSQIIKYLKVVPATFGYFFWLGIAKLIRLTSPDGLETSQVYWLLLDLKRICIVRDEYGPIDENGHADVVARMVCWPKPWDNI